MSVATADKERSRIGSMLGSVGRTRSGSGGSGGGAAGKKDPFATPIGSTTNFGSGNGNGNGNATTGFGGESRSGGPVAGGAARFETSFSHPSDSEEGEFAIHKPTTTATRPSRSHSSSSKPPPLSRDPSFSQPAYSPPLTSPSLASSVRGKLTKPRSGSANSAGLRERAAGMNWGSSAGPGFPASPAEVARRTAGGGRGDDFDDDEDERGEGGLRGAYDGLGEDEWGKSSFGRIAPSKGFPGPPEMEVREKEKEKEKKGIMRRFRSSSGSSSRKNDEGDLSGASAFDTAASPAFAKPKSRLRSSTLPSSSAKQKNKQPSKSPFDDGFDDDASSLSSIDYPPISTSSPTSAAAQDRPNLNRALSKPWDSEDESYFSPPQPSFSARSPPLSQNDSSSSPRTPGGHSLDLRQVEADFATVMDLSRNGGEGEVGSYTLGGRSRSSTVTAAGGRSRSSTVTAGAAGGEGKFRPPGVGKGGIGWATALFDFPGVEVRFFLLAFPLLRTGGEEEASILTRFPPFPPSFTPFATISLRPSLPPTSPISTSFVTPRPLTSFFQQSTRPPTFPSPVSTPSSSFPATTTSGGVRGRESGRGWCRGTIWRRTLTEGMGGEGGRDGRGGEK